MDHQVVELDQQWQIASGYPCVGRIVRITEDGEILVDYPGNQVGPIRARLGMQVPLDRPDQQVLLVFENQDVTLPIIAGVITDKVGDLRCRGSRDGEELTLKATKELTLVCGKSSITLRSDGKVIVKGREILSRASGTNKIRGASVKIN
jgi:Domain of unknown function (DUF6484)